MSRALSSNKLFLGWITTAVFTVMPTLVSLIIPSLYSRMEAQHSHQWAYSTHTLLMEVPHVEMSLARISNNVKVEVKLSGYFVLNTHFPS